MNIYYDHISNHRLRLMEERRNGMACFEDLDAAAPTTVICKKDTVNYYPRTKLGETDVKFACKN